MENGEEYFSENDEKNPQETDIESADDSEWYCDTPTVDDDGEDLIAHSSNSVFAFESDHAALIGNSDYHLLTKTLAELEVQRIKTINDIKKLEALRLKVRENPMLYLNKIISQDSSDFPSRIIVKQVPKIDWCKYKRGSDYEALSANLSNPNSPEANVSNLAKFDDSVVTVRGRIFDQSKPQTFNQLWTAEEQMRLEELLVEYPPEQNENNRWRKIAEALGNRTTSQVCSRVQKYFKKLSGAGLPIPGHQLKTNYMTSIKKHPRKLKKRICNKTTFFPAQSLGAPQLLDYSEVDEEDDEDITVPEITPELKAEIIKRVNEFKRKDAQLSPFSHPDIKCLVCGQSPLQGTRWRCLVCDCVSLCSDCVITQLSTDSPLHPPYHALEPLANPCVVFWDPDYMPDSFKSKNYLDPNFVSTSDL